MTDPDVATVVAHEWQLLEPAVRRSREAVAALLDPDFHEFGSSGVVWDLPSILEMLAGDDNPAPDVDDVAAHRIADDVIHLTYRTRRGGRVTLRSSLWRRRDGAWRLYFHKGTVHL